VIRCSLVQGGTFAVRLAKFCPSRRTPSFPLDSVIPAELRHSRVGGNPSLPRRMGPRIREDDKIVNPSFPLDSVIPPSTYFPRILLSKARGVPEVFFHAPEYVSPIPPNMFSQCEGRTEGCF